MDNHVHLVLKSGIDKIAQAMRNLCSAYAVYFNAIWDHAGHVFQGRYSSFPIESESQLLACVRYVHLNPSAAGICAPEDYEWSSYSQYLGGEGMCNTSIIFPYLDSRDSIKKFHDESNPDKEACDFELGRRRLTSSEAASIADKLFGHAFRETIPALEKSLRNDAILDLYLAGLSGKQIERLTGIGRGIIQGVVYRARNM